MTLKDWIENWRDPLISALLGAWTYDKQYEATIENFLDAIVAVHADAEGDNEGPDWLAVLEFADGRFALMTAGCDYTGWG